MSFDNDIIINAYAELATHIRQDPDSGGQVADKWSGFINKYSDAVSVNDATLIPLLKEIEMIGVNGLISARTTHDINLNIKSFSNSLANVNKKIGKQKASDVFGKNITVPVGGEGVPAKIALKHYNERKKEWKNAGGKKSGLPVPNLEDSTRELQKIKRENDATRSTVTQPTVDEQPKPSVTVYRNRKTGRFQSKHQAIQEHEETLQAPMMPQDVAERREFEENVQGPVAPQEVLEQRYKEEREAVWQARKDRFKSGIKAGARVAGNVAGVVGRMGVLAGGALAATGDPFLARTGAALATPFAAAKGLSAAGKFLTGGWKSGDSAKTDAVGGGNASEETQKEDNDARDKSIGLLEKIEENTRNGNKPGETGDKKENWLDKLKSGFMSLFSGLKGAISGFAGMLGKLMSSKMFAGLLAADGARRVFNNQESAEDLGTSGESSKIDIGDHALAGAEMGAGVGGLLGSFLPGGKVVGMAVGAAAGGLIGAGAGAIQKTFGNGGTLDKDGLKEGNFIDTASKALGGDGTKPDAQKTTDEKIDEKFKVRLWETKSGKKEKIKKEYMQYASLGTEIKQKEYDKILELFGSEEPWMQDLRIEGGSSVAPAPNSSSTVTTNNSTSSVETISKNSAAATKVSESSSVSSEKSVERVAESVEKVGQSIAASSAKGSNTTINNNNKTIMSMREVARNGDSTFQRVMFGNYITV